MTQSKNLIINADDFGISHAANLAVVELYKSGKISSATIMVNLGETSEEAIFLAKDNNIPVGLHFNLTLGRPLSKDVSTLCNSKEEFYHRRDFELRLFRLRGKDIQKELHNQFEFLLSRGIQPTHIDSHQHIHNWPWIFLQVVNFAVSRKTALRVVKEPIVVFNLKGVTLSMVIQLIRKSIFYFFGLINRSIAIHKRVNINNGLYSIFALWPRPVKVNQNHYKKILGKVKDKSEFMVHPIIEKDGTPTSITDYSVLEYNILSELNLKEFNLISFKEI